LRSGSPPAGLIAHTADTAHDLPDGTVQVIDVDESPEALGGSGVNAWFPPSRRPVSSSA
jgi:hypothetical protein